MMPEDVEEMAGQIAALPHLQIEGLMTIAPFVDDPEKIVRFFENYINYLLTSKRKTLIMLTWVSFLWV